MPSRKGTVVLLGALALGWAVFCAQYLLAARMGALEGRMEQHLFDTQKALAQLRLRVDALQQPAAEPEGLKAELREALDDLEARLSRRMEAAEQAE